MSTLNPKRTVTELKDLRNLTADEQGALAGVELWYGGVNPLNMESRAVSRGPSQIVHDALQMAPVLEMDKADIELVKGFYVLAAERARAAGFDIIVIYGLLAYTVSQRSQEIAVRLALGADPARVGRMIVADGMRLAAMGIVPGVLGAYAAARGMSTLLFGVAPGDPATFATAVAVALLVTLAGSVVPVIRAVRVTPMSLLKAE